MLDQCVLVESRDEDKLTEFTFSVIRNRKTQHYVVSEELHTVGCALSTKPTHHCVSRVEDFLRLVECGHQFIQ